MKLFESIQRNLVLIILLSLFIASSLQLQDVKIYDSPENHGRIHDSDYQHDSGIINEFVESKALHKEQIQDENLNQKLASIKILTRQQASHSTVFGERLYDFQEPSDEVNAVDFSPDGKYLASGDDTGAIRMWNVATGNELQLSSSTTLSGSTVEQLAFSSDNTILASAGSGNDVNIRI